MWNSTQKTDKVMNREKKTSLIRLPSYEREKVGLRTGHQRPEGE